MESQIPSNPNSARKTVKTILLQSILTFVIGVLVLGLILSLIAGTFTYWQAWGFTIIFALGTVTQGIYLSFLDPELLERRKQIAPSSESIGERIFIVIGLLSTFGLMIFCALDHRFSWSHMPFLISIAGYAFVGLSFLMYYLVFRVNSFASISIQTFPGQKVVSNGPYAILRHPKYLGDLILIVGIPLALGSWWGLTILILTIPSLAWRILDEETLLKKDLPGYVEYARRVGYRLIPYFW